MTAFLPRRFQHLKPTSDSETTEVDVYSEQESNLSCVLFHLDQILCFWANRKQSILYELQLDFFYKLPCCTDNYRWNPNKIFGFQIRSRSSESRSDLRSLITSWFWSKKKLIWHSFQLNPLSSHWGIKSQVLYKNFCCNVFVDLNQGLVLELLNQTMIQHDEKVPDMFFVYKYLLCHCFYLKST